MVLHIYLYRARGVRKEFYHKFWRKWHFGRDSDFGYQSNNTETRDHLAQRHRVRTSVRAGHRGHNNHTGWQHISDSNHSHGNNQFTGGDVNQGGLEQPGCGYPWKQWYTSQSCILLVYIANLYFTATITCSHLTQCYIVCYYTSQSYNSFLLWMEVIWFNATINSCHLSLLQNVLIY